ncbi:MAG TPA: carnitine dehydratase [Alphaproteobacteria bacterium]|nr:carnitine dehydratase [Alphaproteobacteria bacterium]
MQKAAGALDGVRVLDFTGVVAGPFGTRLMADLGAEVVKVEPPSGDLLRGAPPRRDGKSPYFGQINCGKKSISVDLKDPRARDLVLQLVDKTDVVIQNFRPGVMRNFGLGYDDLKQRKPDLIYCSISGYGQHGPASGRAAYAPIIHAASGYDLAVMSYQDHLDRPLNGANATADYLAASLAMGAISAALLKRERTGKGDEIDIAMTEVMQNILAYEIHELQFKAERQRPNYGPVRTKDGFIIVNPISPKNFSDLANAVGHPEWLEQFPLNTKDRLKNWSLLMAELEKWTCERTAEECEEIIREGGCPCSRYRDVWDSMHDPQVDAREGVVEINDGAGSYLIPTTPLRLMQSEARPKPFVPELGGNNAEILQSWLGMDQSDIDRLAEQGVLFCAA